MVMTSVVASKETRAFTAVFVMLVASNFHLVGHGPGLVAESTNLPGIVYVTGLVAAMRIERDFVVSPGVVSLDSNPLSQAGS
jgi:hypothetical protein